MLFDANDTKKDAKKAAHLQTGQNAEQQAFEYLLAAGLRPVARNFRCKFGELDLLMLDGQTLVVVEVRFRKSNRYGSALESVTPAKQSRIITATQFYLSSHPNFRQIRFDVVALSGDGGMDWIKNAFQS